MTRFKNQEGKSVISEINFPIREKNEWKKLSTSEVFKGKKVVVFSLPGAFTPTCSSTHLPRYEDLYDTFKANGIDEVYCISVNDTLVMNEWAKSQQIEKVKMLPDGNTDFTQSLGMLIAKEDLGFGKRSWRYSMLIDDGKVIKHFIEPDKKGDPFEVSDADTMLRFINPKCKKPESITIFSKKECQFCDEIKELFKQQGKQYSEIVLSDAVRQKILSSITGLDRPTVPQVFIDGKLIGGVEEYKKLFTK